MIRTYDSRYGAPLSPVLSTAPAAYDYGTGWVISPFYLFLVLEFLEKLTICVVRYGAPLAPVVSYEYASATTAAPTLAPSTQTQTTQTQTQTTYAQTTSAVAVPEEEVRSLDE